MKKFEITDKDAFLLYAKEFDENDNDYLTEAEPKAAESFTTIEDEEVTDEEVLVESDESRQLRKIHSREEPDEDVTEDDVTESEDEDISEEVAEETTAEVAEDDEVIVDDQDDEIESSPEEYLAIFFQLQRNKT